MSSYFEIKNVSKGFGNRRILKDVSLSVERGKTVGLVGANGSGKSVLFKILCGFEKPDQAESVYAVSSSGRKAGIFRTTWGCSLIHLALSVFTAAFRISNSLQIFREELAKRKLKRL